MTFRISAMAALAAAGAGLFAQPALAGDAESCKTVRFADVGWTDIQVTTGATQVVLEALGYAPEVKTLSVPVTYASLKNKDIDAFLGNWMPSMTADVRSSAGRNDAASFVARKASRRSRLAASRVAARCVAGSP